MGSVRFQLVESSIDGPVAPPVLLRGLSERELWRSALVGTQFPKLDMLPPFEHSGAELSGWQPPDVNSQDSGGARIAGDVWVWLLGYIGMLWLAEFSLVLW